MRRVMDADMVAHVWAEQAQSDARVQRGNFFFRGETIYSYGTHFPIATWVKNRKGERAALFTTRTYSITTSKHLGMVRRALYKRPEPVFNIEEPTIRPDHRENLSKYQARIKAEAESAARARSNREWKIARAEETAREANSYAAFFGLKWRTPDVFDPAFLETARVRCAAEAASKARQARKAEKERARREAEALAQYRAEVERWVAGEDVTLSRVWFGPGRDEPTRLRLRGDVVQTTQGAEVPADHARRLWPLILRCRATGTEYKRNGHTVHVGHFAIDAIDTEGNLTAGCHYIAWPEVQRMARVLGLEV